MTATHRWEHVYTINDFFDFPLLGVADFEGAPNVFQRIFDPEADDWSPTCRLRPISASELAAVSESWDIWLRWQSAFHAGTLTEADRNPALEVDRPRLEELEPLVARYLVADNGLTARPEFRGSMHPFDMQVLWTRPSTLTPNV